LINGFFMKSALSTVAVAIGVLLLAVSFLWGVLFPAKSGWTEDKGARLADLTKQVHNLMFEDQQAKEKPSKEPGKTPAEVHQRYVSAKSELETLSAEFAGKRDAPKTAAGILRWSGIAFVAAGAVILFAKREG
jgi:hypothetical protein